MSTVPVPPVSDGSSSQALKVAALSLLKNKAYMVTACILLVAAVGLHAATQQMQLHFRKMPVSLRQPINTLPEQLGPWQQVSLDMPLSPDIEEVLGTDKYIFRNFVDTRRVSPATLARFKDKDYRERLQILAEIQANDPRAVVMLSVTYYTGMVDTVAHIPDRCFIADGFQPTVYETPRWKLPGFSIDSGGYHVGADGKRISIPADAGGEDEGLPVRFINFEDQDSRSRSAQSRSVTYFFSVNGRYEANPIGVRSTLQNLFENHGYYAKVELMTVVRDPKTSMAVKQDFLTHALPELEQRLPDWAAVKATTTTATATTAGGATGATGTK